MKIYLNQSFECFTASSEQTIKEVETDFFNGKCKAFIEGYRLVPQGELWTRADGQIFTGEMITPFKDSQTLDMMQNLYEEITITNLGGTSNV